MQMLIPGRGFLHGFTKRLSNSEILTLPTLGAQLTEAPGLNKIITINSCIFILNSLNGSYSDINGASLVLGLGTVNNLQYNSTFIKTGFILNSTQINLGQFQVPSDQVGTDDFDGELAINAQFDSNAINTPLFVKDDWNGLSDYTGGNSLNYMIFSGTYLIFNTITGQFE